LLHGRKRSHQTLSAVSDLKRKKKKKKEKKKKKKKEKEKGKRKCGNRTVTPLHEKQALTCASDMHCNSAGVCLEVCAVSHGSGRLQHVHVQRWPENDSEIAGVAGKDHQFPTCCECDIKALGSRLNEWLDGACSFAKTRMLVRQCVGDKWEAEVEMEGPRISAGKLPPKLASAQMFGAPPRFAGCLEPCR
jgi:hypothetical protein